MIGAKELRLPNTLNIAFEDVEADSLLMLLDRACIATSSGSACASGSMEPSHVLRAMKIPFAYLRGAVRFSFSLKEKLAIALALERAGVDEIEAGNPAMGVREIEEIVAIGAALSTAVPIAWCRMTCADVDAARETGLTRVNLSIPLSDIQIQAKLRANRAQVLERIQGVVSYARDWGMGVAMGGEDSARADLGFLITAVEIAASAGAHRFRFADTLGSMEPFGVYEIFRTLRAALSLELEFHGHDDLGLATANTLAAIRGGATHASVCILGLGERAGNAALEE